jgi:hypothetical protein
LQEKNIDKILETCQKFGLKEETIQKIALEHQTKAQITSRKEKLANLKAVEPVCLTRYRNARFIMANPLFSCDQKKRIEPIEYRYFDSEGHERFVQVTANATYGMATQRDADIIRFAISKIGEIGQQTGHYPDTIEESAYAILKAIGKNNKKENYVWLREAIQRLSGHVIHTNTFTSDRKTIFLESIAGFEWVEQESRTIKKLKIRLAKRLINTIRERGILAIDIDRFFARKDLKRYKKILGAFASNDISYLKRCFSLLMGGYSGSHSTLVAKKARNADLRHFLRLVHRKT